MFSGLNVNSTGDLVSYVDNELDVEPEFYSETISDKECSSRKHGLPKWTYQRQMSYLDADLPFNTFGDYLIAILEDDDNTIDTVLRLYDI